MRTVIKPVQSSQVDTLPLNSSRITSFTTHSTRAASYAEAGWFDAQLPIDSPWVNISADENKPSQTFVIGRWSYHMCRLALPRRLEPCDEFKAEIDQAVSIGSIEQRREALERIFDYWGDCFAAEVEMGGAKYGRIRRATNSEVRAEIETSLLSIYLTGLVV
jgi:hypothetical protein